MAKDLVSFAFHYNPERGTGVYYDPRYADKTFDEVIVAVIQAHPTVRNITITVNYPPLTQGASCLSEVTTDEDGDPIPSVFDLYIVTILLIFVLPIIALAIGGDAGLRMLFADLVVMWVYALAR